MKLVGVISDTHIPARSKGIPKAVFDIFEDVSLIVHAGDLTRVSVIDELEQMAPVLAVHGNMDSRVVKERLPVVNSIKLYDWKIGVTHSLGFLYHRGSTSNALEKQGFHVFISGHTHRSAVKYKRNLLLINPGSPTNPIPPFLVKPSVALLRITKKEIEPEIIHL